MDICLFLNLYIRCNYIMHKMFKESLYNFFLFQVNRIEENILLPGSLENEEIIHICRLCLKKIKTILLFFERLKIPWFSEDLLIKKENELFNLLGKIREFNKQYSRLNEFNDNEPFQYDKYQNFLEKNERKLKNKIKKKDLFVMIKHLKSIQHSILEILDMYDDAYLYDEAVLFISGEFKKIEAVKDELESFKNWHFIRKCLKNIMYIVSLISDSHYKSVIDRVTLNEIDKLQNNIGEWHDDIVSFELCLKFLDKNKDIDQNTLDIHRGLIQRFL